MSVVIGALRACRQPAAACGATSPNRLHGHVVRAANRQCKERGPGPPRRQALERLHGPLAKSPFLVTDNGSSFLARAFRRQIDGDYAHVRIGYRTTTQLGLLERFPHLTVLEPGHHVLNAGDAGLSVFPRHQGSVLQLAANLQYHRCRGDEQRGPTRIGGDGHHDVTGADRFLERIVEERLTFAKVVQRRSAPCAGVPGRGARCLSGKQSAR